MFGRKKGEEACVLCGQLCGYRWRSPTADGISVRVHGPQTRIQEKRAEEKKTKGGVRQGEATLPRLVPWQTRPANTGNRTPHHLIYFGWTLHVDFVSDIITLKHEAVP